MSFFDPTNPLLDVNLFVDYPISKDELWADSELKDVGRVPARVCSIEHLIRMKIVAGRPKDLEDVRLLRTMQADA